MEGSAENKPRSRRRPARARVAPGEKAICLLLLAAIPVAAGAIYAKGKHYDPRLFSPDAALTRAMSRRAALPTKIAAENSVLLAPAAGGAPVTGASGVPAGMSAPGIPAAPGSLPALPGASPLAPAAVAGRAAQAAQGSLPPSFGDPSWAMSTPVQRFKPDNLYEKVDGRSEQYLKYGFVSLETATYTDRRDSNRFIDAFVYDMGKAGNAFGIFSIERPPDSSPVKLGEQGYRAASSFFFTRGRYYVQVVAADQGTVFQEAGLKLARALDTVLSGTPAAAPTAALPQLAAAPRPASGKPAVAPRPVAVRPAQHSAPAALDYSSPAVMLSLFPPQEMVADSLQYLKQDALGMDFLSEVFTVRYHVGGQDYTLFLTKCAQPKQAKDTATKYAAFLKQFGTLRQHQNVGPVIFLGGAVSDLNDAVFQAGPFLGGVSAAANREQAETLALRLLHTLVERAPKLAPSAARKITQWPAPASNGSKGESRGADQP